MAIVVVLALTLGATAYAVAYQKIHLPTKMQNIELAIANFAQSLPFTPKTPEFLLSKALIAQDEINKESYDISLAVDSPNATLIPELGSRFDILAKGSIDYSSLEDIKFTLNANATKDFNVEFLKPNDYLYFKINKIPSLLLSFIGMKVDVFDPILNKWYYYDLTPLETEARAELEENTGDKQLPGDKFVKDNLDKYIDERILKEIKLKTETVDGFAVYTLSVDADTELIDYIGGLIEEEQKKERGSDMEVFYDDSNKLSDIIKSTHWEISIDRQKYYVRKVVIIASMEVDEINNSYGALLGTSSLMPEVQIANFALVAKFSDFGNEVIVDAPVGAKSWEDFTNTLSEIFNKMYSDTIGNSYNKARDAKTKSDLASISKALEFTKSDTGRYPATLDELTPLYFAGIPTDNEGNSYYYVSKDSNTYDLCANLEIPEPEMNTCPNLEYNYHLSINN